MEGKPTSETRAEAGKILVQRGFAISCIGLGLCLAMRDIPQFAMNQILLDSDFSHYLLAIGRGLPLLAAIPAIKVLHVQQGDQSKKLIYCMAAIALVLETAGFAIISFRPANSPIGLTACFILGFGQSSLIVAWVAYLLQRPRKELYMALVGALLVGGFCEALLACMQPFAATAIEMGFPSLSTLALVVCAHAVDSQADSALRKEKPADTNMRYPDEGGFRFDKELVAWLLVLWSYSFIARLLADLWMNASGGNGLGLFAFFGGVGTILASLLVWLTFTTKAPVSNRLGRSFFAIPIVCVALYLSTFLTGVWSILFVIPLFMLRKMILTNAIGGTFRFRRYADRLQTFCWGMLFVEFASFCQTGLIVAVGTFGIPENIFENVLAILLLTYAILYEFRGFLNRSSGNWNTQATMPSEAERDIQRREDVLASMKSDYGFSAREMDVLDLLLHGRNAEYIAKTLIVAHSTAKTHIAHIYQKGGFSSQQMLMDEFERRMEEARAK